jgi:selenocysteine-specific elongation factor
MKKHTIIGTAGHIDHGKTTLIKALTGIDADRLKEEKERGITIDIGFAYWKMDVTIIDVPGHEKFIRNMVAGVSTIDFFMLVIAADDGIMPQTIEHLDILTFFNIRDGIIVINKIDLVDEELLELVREEVEELLINYKLEHLPVICVSSISQENINSLKELIEQKIERLEDKHSDNLFRLSVDRSFSIKGFGTVVTGTVLSGTLDAGDEIEIMPAGQKVKVRGIQAHTANTKHVEIGFRAAVNLQGINKVDIKRGDFLAEINTMSPVSEFIGIMRTVAKIPFKIPNHCRVHVYAGTAERLGNLIWYEKTKHLAENSTYHVRVKLQSPLSSAQGDPFLIRLHSPVTTIAGGQILEINPPKIKVTENDWKRHFTIMSGNDLTQILEQIVLNYSLRPPSLLDLQKKIYKSADSIQTHIQKLLDRKILYRLKIKGIDCFLHNSALENFSTDILNYLSVCQQKFPHKPGINRQELFTGLGKNWVQLEIFNNVIDKLIFEKQIKSEQNLISRFEFKIKISKGYDQATDELLKKIKEGRFAPPNVEVLASELKMSKEELKSLLSILSKEKSLILINNQFYLHTEHWQKLLAFLHEYFSKNTKMPVATLKDYIQTTRKYAIPLFEYLDSEGYTRREGDVRTKGVRNF